MLSLLILHFLAFRAFLKVDKDEYLPWVDTEAMMIFVHNQSEGIFGESVRYNAIPGARTSLSVRQVRQLLFPAYRAAHRSAHSQYVQWNWRFSDVSNPCNVVLSLCDQSIVCIISFQSVYKRLGGKYGECVKTKSEVKSYYYTGEYSTPVRVENITIATYP